MRKSHFYQPHLIADWLILILFDWIFLGSQSIAIKDLIKFIRKIL